MLTRFRPCKSFLPDIFMTWFELKCFTARTREIFEYTMGEAEGLVFIFMYVPKSKHRGQVENLPFKF